MPIGLPSFLTLVLEVYLLPQDHMGWGRGKIISHTLYYSVKILNVNYPNLLELEDDAIACDLFSPYIHSHLFTFIHITHIR